MHPTNKVSRNVRKVHQQRKNPFVNRCCINIWHDKHFSLVNEPKERERRVTFDLLALLFSIAHLY